MRGEGRSRAERGRIGAKAATYRVDLEEQQVSARRIGEVAKDDLADQGDGLTTNREVVELGHGAGVSS
jgi:hypothetical protein